MKDNRRREIERRIKQRKKLNQRNSSPIQNEPERKMIYPEYQDEHEYTGVFGHNSGSNNEDNHPLFKKETFILKILISAILVLLVAISYKLPSTQLEPVRSTVSNVMEREFQFAMVANWYEDTFGKPLALFPAQLQEDEGTEAEGYALPANGVILEEFALDHNGVTIQTELGVPVEVIQDGVITFAGENDEFGNTVIVQHVDNTETWYGNLGEIKVRPLENVKAGDIIGVVSSSDNEVSGEFYFAIKKDEQFIDPVQVIKFE